MMSHNLTPPKAVKMATQVAGQSMMRHKLGAVLYSRDKYVVGYNRSFGVEVSDRSRPFSIHAEEMCILKGIRVGIVFDDSTLVVVRINKNGDLRRSMPCEMCSRLIEKLGVKIVWYVG